MTIPEVITLLAACGAFVGVVATAFVSIWNAVHLAQVHTLVNSQSVRMEALSARAGYAEGQVAGALPAPIGPPSGTHVSLQPPPV